MKSIKLLLASAALALSAQASSAAVIYADSVISANQGLCTTPSAVAAPADRNVNNCANDRSDANDALGAADGDFFALGDGGDITLGFSGGPFTSGRAAVFEVTFDRTVGHDEAVEVIAIDGGFETSFGIITNIAGANSVLINIAFDSLKLVDKTYTGIFASTTSFDGFDVDSVSVAAVPLPATGLMLLGGLAGFGAMRRRKKAA